jgi:branched-chain amino acid transport system substrate-binding protein
MEGPSMRNLTRLLLVATVLMAVHTTAARAEILIGAAGPLTGQTRGQGEQLMRGADMAVADLNARGGVLGQRLRLIIVDDACDADQAVAAATQLVSQKVAMVMGHGCSGASIPASKLYTKAGIVMISPMSTNPKLTDEGAPNVFRVIGRDDQQGAVAGDYLTERWGKAKIAILHDGQPYGKGLAEETRKRLSKRGVPVAMYEDFQQGEKDYSGLVAKLRAAEIAVVYVGSYVTEAALILRQARDQGYGLELVSGDGLAIDEFWLITGPAGEGTMFTFAPDPRRNKEAAAVVARFRAAKIEPEGYTLHAYAAIQAWAQAAIRAGSLESPKVSAALKGQQFDTVLGKIGFDKKGDVTSPAWVWYVWTQGKWIPK